jgi:hypothetical protein
MSIQTTWQQGNPGAQIHPLNEQALDFINTQIQLFAVM